MSGRLAIVLAAGKGTRMKSELPKVMVPICDRPMIDFVLDALDAAGVVRILVVVGYQADTVRDHLAGREGVEFVVQSEQLGTGHAVKMCADHLADHDGPVLIVTGDSPLTQPGSLTALFDLYDNDGPACILGTAHKDAPDGLGRIVRDDAGRFVRIVEQKDADEDQIRITEVNMSTYVFDSRSLLASLDKIENDNRQREYYVTDCPGILRQDGRDVRALDVLQPCESLSVNTIDDLRVVESEMKRLGYS